MDKDFVKDLGFLGVTARLKRLSDSISYSIKEMYKKQNIAFEPSWHLYILFLREYPLSSMTEISESLRITLDMLRTADLKARSHVLGLEHPDMMRSAGHLARVR